MRFQDLFVPRWQHSNPDVRKRAVGRMKDAKLLRQIAEKDDDETVRQTAAEQLKQLNEQVQVTQ
jgi:exonuclease SbcC